MCLKKSKGIVLTRSGPKRSSPDLSRFVDFRGWMEEKIAHFSSEPAVMIRKIQEDLVYIRYGPKGAHQILRYQFSLGQLSNRQAT